MLNYIIPYLYSVVKFVPVVFLNRNTRTSLWEKERGDFSMYKCSWAGTRETVVREGKRRSYEIRPKMNVWVRFWSAKSQGQEHEQPRKSVGVDF